MKDRYNKDDGAEDGSAYAGIMRMIAIEARTDRHSVPMMEKQRVTIPHEKMSGLSQKELGILQSCGMIKENDAGNGTVIEITGQFVDKLYG